MNHICFALSITNIFISLFVAGLESAKSENYEEAFTCFLAAAQQGYSKACHTEGQADMPCSHAVIPPTAERT